MLRIAAETTPTWPLGLYVAMVVLLAGAILLVSYFLGERHRERATGAPYEGGMAPTGSARLRFSAEFYLVAIFFVLFDLEAVFLFAWAVCARDAAVGWRGYAAAAVFVAVLLAALAYLWRVGALDWGAASRKKSPPAGGAERGAR